MCERFTVVEEAAKIPTPKTVVNLGRLDTGLVFIVQVTLAPVLPPV